jgi:hypothetical protein
MLKKFSFLEAKFSPELLLMSSGTGLPDFINTIYQNRDITYNKRPHKIPNLSIYQINQKILIRTPSEMYQNWGFGLKINHLATLRRKWLCKKLVLAVN